MTWEMGLTAALRVVGGGLLLLALAHIPIGRHLGWREDALRMNAVNGNVFRVHVIFICVVLVVMGLPPLVDPGAMLERTALGRWVAALWAGFWVFRLCCQWFVYPQELWRGKRFETRMHWLFTLIWIYLAAVFGLVSAWQWGLTS